MHATVAQSEKPTGHLGSLDALRGVAILGVLVTHASAVTLQTSLLARVLDAAKIGVELFYLVSASTIFMAVDRRSTEAHPTTNFYLRRFFRIAPMFYLSLMLNFIRLRFSFVHGYRPSLPGYFLGVLFLFGFSPMLMLALVVGGWSIAVETTFYVLVPLLRRWLRSLRPAMIAFLVCYVFLNAGDALLTRHYASSVLLEEYFGVLWFPAQLPVFLLGIAIYFWWKEAHSSSRPKAPVMSAVILVLAGAGFLVKHLAQTPGFHASDLAFDTFVAGGFLLSILMHPWRWIVNAFTRYLGKLSYSIYLLHIFLMEITPKVSALFLHRSDSFLGLPFGHFSSFFVFLIVNGVLAVAIATLSWRWIEQPGIRLGRKLIARREGRTGGGSPRFPGLLSKADTPDAQF